MMTLDSDLKIELGKTSAHDCPCCGKQSQTVHGYLFKPDGETSVYFAGYTPGHPERRVNIVLSVGGWGQGTTPDDRQAIAMEAKAQAGAVAFTFSEPASSPWFGENFLGVMRSPASLSSEERQRFIGLSKTAATEDPRVATYLASGDAMQEGM